MFHSKLIPVQNLIFLAQRMRYSSTNTCCTVSFLSYSRFISEVIFFIRSLNSVTEELCWYFIFCLVNYDCTYLQYLQFHLSSVVAKMSDETGGINKSQRSFVESVDFIFYNYTTLKTYHLCFTLKQRGNGRFHVVSTWNNRGVFVWSIQISG